MENGSKHKALANTKIGFFGKGGAGKSTAVALIARALAEAGYTVCIVDADSTNVGLHQALGLDRPPAPLIDYYGGMIFSGGLVTCPVDDPTPLEGAEISLDACRGDCQETTESCRGACSGRLTLATAFAAGFGKAHNRRGMNMLDVSAQVAIRFVRRISLR